MRNQLIIVGIAVALIIGIYQLPKTVVSKKQNLPAPDTKSKTAETKKKEETHQIQLNALQTEKLAFWKKEIQHAVSIEKKHIFADSIANLFRTINRIDSAAYYYGQAFSENDTAKYQVITANTWFEAFKFALSVDANRANEYGEQARIMYEKVLSKNPKLYTAKANMAMTFVATPTPMKGITLLREIIAEDPKNELALLNLGLLAIQSKQYDKAVSRFDTLLKVNPNHIEAKLYLAESLLNIQDIPRAKKLLTEITKLTADSLAIYKQIAKETLDNLK